MDARADQRHNAQQHDQAIVQAPGDDRTNHENSNSPPGTNAIGRLATRTRLNSANSGRQFATRLNPNLSVPRCPLTFKPPRVPSPPHSSNKPAGVQVAHEDDMVRKKKRHGNRLDRHRSRTQSNPEILT